MTYVRQQGELMLRSWDCKGKFSSTQWPSKTLAMTMLIVRPQLVMFGTITITLTLLWTTFSEYLSKHVHLLSFLRFNPFSVLFNNDKWPFSSERIQCMWFHVIRKICQNIKTELCGYLHSILLVGDKFHTGLHCGMSPLAQNFIQNLVNILIMR